MTASAEKPRDYRQEVTDQIIRLLEEGAAPWQKPWKDNAQRALPVRSSAITK